MRADPASDILKLARARTVLTGGFTAGGAWAIRFPAPQRIKFCVIVRGDCWISIDGRKQPLHAETNDVLMMAAPLGFVMGSAPSVKPVGMDALTPNPATQIFQLGQGNDFMQLGGHLELDVGSGALLSSVMPPWIHIQASSSEATPLRWLIEQLAREQLSSLPGSRLALEQLGQLIFVHILRAHLVAMGTSTVGWPQLLADPGLSEALRLMHGEPSRDWQLQQLSRAASMSRTTFAQKFRAAAGVAPLTYLTQWRMQLARQALSESDASLTEIADSLGYASESGFSHAFKRVTGQSPKRYRAEKRTIEPK